MESLRENIRRGVEGFPLGRYRKYAQEPGVYITDAHWHAEQEILYMKSGSAELLCDGVPLVLLPGDVAFIPPNALHSICAVQPDCGYVSCVFSYALVSFPAEHFFQKETIEPLRTGKLTFPGVIRSQDALSASVTGIMERLCRYDHKSVSGQRDALGAVLELCLTLAPHLQSCDGLRYPPDNTAVRKCLNYLQEHFAEKLTLEQIAEQVYLHPNYLCAVFKSYVGKTVFGYLIQLRIQYAAELLRNGHCSAKQAAAAAGFENAGYFTRQFRAVMGISPGAYKKLSAD